MPNVDKNKLFSSLVRSTRDSVGITAEDLAEKTGIDRTYISKIEQKNLLPSYDIAFKIASALGNPQILEEYMYSKYPNAADYFSNRFQRSLGQEILGLILDKKDDSAILKRYLSGSVKNDPSAHSKFLLLIKSLRNSFQIEKDFMQAVSK